MTVYRGRFAPSPTGPLHAGSLVAALASWLDARAHGGQWLVRMEDVDTRRCVAGMDETILTQLSACGLQPDEPPWVQSQRSTVYADSLDRLVQAGRAYACGCTRADIDTAWAAQGVEHQRHAERIYPGTCRDGLHGKPARAWRLRADGVWAWHDRRLGPQQQDLRQAVGDFVLRRADGLWAYQLAVVVDDAAQGITHVVRGEDLADNTPRQIALQHALGLATPHYLHTPLVRAADGYKLSKQNGAAALSLDDPVAAVAAALRVLGMPAHAGTLQGLLSTAVQAWAARWPC
jgi:glutamyl-Q tRNA(Asp) synthetase